MAGRPGSQESAKADCQREHRHEVHAPGAHSTSPSACPRRQNWNIHVVADLAQTGPVPAEIRDAPCIWTRSATCSAAGEGVTVFTTGPVTKVGH
jgi:hypothetical protein